MNNEDLKSAIFEIKCALTHETSFSALACIEDYITNLQEKVDQYENPDDLTLFYMWLDEKAKDKIKQLQEDLEKVSGSHFKLFQENKRLQDRNIELVLERDRLKEEIKNLTHIVANKIIEDYDIDTPLKNQLNEERIKYINLDVVCNDYKSRNEKANTLLDELLERAYIDGEYILYDYSTSELLEVKQALQGEDKE